jgi:hypothetical protein
MKNKKYHTVGTIPKSYIKIVERDKIDTPNTNTWTVSFLAVPGTSIKSGGVKLVYKPPLQVLLFWFPWERLAANKKANKARVPSS